MGVATGDRLYDRIKASRANAFIFTIYSKTFKEAGFPNGVVNFVPGFGPEAGAKNCKSS